MVLVFFCGVRVEEVGRLGWDDIKLNRDKPIVDMRKTKKGRRRIPEIPENACWLRLCVSSGRVAPDNYTKRMQRLRRRAGVQYPQNAARHCFASYHLECFGDAAKTVLILGHRNPALLYATYREVVTPEDASSYFQILPKCVQDERKTAAERRVIELDQAAKELAEEESNCGQAVRDQFGQWTPVQEFGLPAETREVFDQFWATKAEAYS